MKKLIIVTFVLVFFSCKEEITINKKENITWYNTILKEIEKVNTSEYYITYQIEESLESVDEFKRILDNLELQKNKESNLEGDFYLSKSIKDKINESLLNKEKKIELNYSFSNPYLLKDSTIVIYNILLFKNGKHILGGGTRVFFLEQKGKNYFIKKTTALKDY
jgi:hypothetical protein